MILSQYDNPSEFLALSLFKVSMEMNNGVSHLIR